MPIGKPIANTQVYILDSHGEPAPIGVPGELFAAGDGVAKGYLADAAAATAKFVRDPFSARSDAMMYRTGDLARWRADGTIEFLGRRDRQVKVRGFRIELEEIEDALRSLEGLQDAAVIARRDSTGVNVLIGYLVPRKDYSIDVTEVRRHLGSMLPEYMVPADFVSLDKLPLTSNGKLDRAALPDPTTRAAAHIVEPRSMIETQLLAIWERVLGHSNFGIRQNFFELGGHSLLAVRMFAHVERVFGRRLPASALFQAPTVELLAARLENEGFRSPWAALVPIQPEGNKPALFMVPGIGGNVVGYADMARLLGSDQPFYGLQSRGLDGRDKPFDTIEAMATHYIREIRSVQPTGPYYLGGACFGGAVAYEMAQQLHAAGEKVAFLLMLETWPPPRHRPVLDRVLRYSYQAKYLVEAIRRNLLGLVRLSPAKMIAALRQHSRAVTEIIVQRDIYRGDSAAVYMDRVSTSNYRAFARYQPRPYEGEVMLVVASARKVSSRNDPRLLWGSLARRYTRFDVPALDSGLALKSPHVEVLAAWTREGLRQARASVEASEPAPHTERRVTESA